jgi:hypothetical protein
MSRERLKQLAAQLDRELRRTHDLDSETRELLKKLDDELDEITDGAEDSLSRSVRELESRFAAEHPTAARIARDLADMLAKMGI